MLLSRSGSMRTNVSGDVACASESGTSTESGTRAKRGHAMAANKIRPAHATLDANLKVESSP